MGARSSYGKEYKGSKASIQLRSSYGCEMKAPTTTTFNNLGALFHFPKNSLAPFISEHLYCREDTLQPLARKWKRKSPSWVLEPKYDTKMMKHTFLTDVLLFFTVDSLDCLHFPNTLFPLKTRTDFVQRPTEYTRFLNFWGGVK